MKIKSSLYLFATFLLTSQVLAIAVGAQGKGGFAQNESDLAADPRVIYGTLDNGLRYAVMKNSTPSNVAAIRMRIATGSLNETEAQQGIAHFLEHMAFNGSKNVPEGEMVKRLERHGLSFGADTNASTGFDQTIYKLNLPTVDEAVLDEAFFLMRETAENLTLDPEAIERERGVIASEKRSRDSINFRAAIDSLKFFTSGSGLTDRLPIGTDETIATMPKAEFVKYYNGYYRPENTFIAFIGDIDTATAINKIKAFFADWKPAQPALPDIERKAAQITPGKLGYYHDDKILTFVSLGALQPYEKRVDNILNRQKNLLRGLGNHIVNRRLHRKLEGGDAPYLSAKVTRFVQKDTVNGMIIRMRSAPDKWAEALAAGDQEIRRALSFGFSAGELSEALANIRQALKIAVDRADTQKTYAGFEYNYARALVQRFAGERVFTSPGDNLRSFERFAEKITVEDVEHAFRESWKSYDKPQIYLATSAVVADPKAEIGAAFLAARQVMPTPPEDRQVGKFAYTDFGKPGRVLRDEYIKDPDANLITFDNNVRLNFKHTDYDAGTINISVKVGGGFLSMPRKSEGLRRLALNLLNRSGVEGHTSDDLMTIFAGKRVHAAIKLRIDEGAFEITGLTNAEDLSNQLNLMAAHVIAPAYRDKVVKQYRDAIRAWYPTHDATPRTVADKELPRLVRSGDTRYGYSDLDSFMSPTIDEVREWIDPQFKAGFIEITVVGDIDKAAVIAQVARTFGALPKRADSKGDYAEMRVLNFPAATGKPFKYYHQGNPDQAMVRVYWPAPDATDPVNGFRMRVLRSIFRNRLTEVLREKMGATYSPRAGTFSNALFKDYGYIFASVTVAPEKADEVQQAILAVAAELTQQTIDDDVFQRALKPIVEDLDSLRENNRYWMKILGDAQTDSHGIRQYLLREPTYHNMTIADINTLAAQVFDNSTALSAYILPASMSPLTPRATGGYTGAEQH